MFKLSASMPRLHCQTA